MYEALEFYDSNGYDLKEVLKSCIYKYYINNKNLESNPKNTIKNAEKKSIIKSTNKVELLSCERS